MNKIAKASLKSATVIYRRGVIPKESHPSLSSDESSSDEEPPIIETIQDKRLQRLAASEPDGDDGRAGMKARLLKSTEEAESNLSTSKLDRRPKVQENSESSRRPIPLKETGRDRESSQDSDSDSEDESEDDDVVPMKIMLKPVFVPKKSRETIIVQERIEKEADLLEVQRLEKIEFRKQESSEIVLDALRKEMVEAEAKIQEMSVDDTDGLDEEEEFQAWKLRELMRIKRDLENREYRLVDEEDVDRRRNMSDSQVADENVTDGTLGVEKEKMKFMQRYYHKGAFFVDDEKINSILQNTDTIAPTLGDHADRTAMPTILQVKNFGMAGRTKYTHLVDQDTTGADSAWSRPENISDTMLKRMGGMKSSFTKPSSNKRKADS